MEVLFASGVPAEPLTVRLGTEQPGALARCCVVGFG